MTTLEGVVEHLEPSPAVRVVSDVEELPEDGPVAGSHEDLLTDLRLVRATVGDDRDERGHRRLLDAGAATLVPAEQTATPTGGQDVLVAGDADRLAQRVVETRRAAGPQVVGGVLEVAEVDVDGRQQPGVEGHHRHRHVVVDDAVEGERALDGVLDRTGAELVRHRTTAVDEQLPGGLAVDVETLLDRQATGRLDLVDEQTTTLGGDLFLDGTQLEVTHCCPFHGLVRLELVKLLRMQRQLLTTTIAVILSVT